MIPYTFDNNDQRFLTTQGFNSGEQFFTYLKDGFDLLYAEGAECPRMMSIGLHCRVVGRPGRAQALARFMDYVQSHEGVWLCRREEIAKHWRANFPMRRRERATTSGPSRGLGRDGVGRRVRRFHASRTERDPRRRRHTLEAMSCALDRRHSVGARRAMVRFVGGEAAGTRETTTRAGNLFLDRTNAARRPRSSLCDVSEGGHF